MNVNTSAVQALNRNITGQTGLDNLIAYITTGNVLSDFTTDSLLLLDNKSSLPWITNNGTPRYSDVAALTHHNWSDTTSYTVGVISLVLASVGILLNTIVIFSIIQNHQLRSHISNVLICNLAVGSLLACVIILSVEVPVRFMSKSSSHQVGPTTCDMIGFVTSVLNIGTVWSVVALSIDKYRSIDSPLHHSIMANTVKSVTYFLIIWILSSILSSIPFLVGQNYVFQPAEGTCDFSYSGNLLYPYILVYLGLVFYIPAVVVCFCHWRIFAIARSQSRRMAAMVHLVTLIHVPLLNGRMANQQISPQGRKAIYTTTIFVGTFLLCYGPHAMTAIGRIFWEQLNNQMLVSITTLLLRSSFTVNIFIYGCRNRMVRDSFAKYVRRKLLERKSSIHWKRRHRGSTEESRREIVRVDRGPNHRRSCHWPVLHPVRSQPNLGTAQITPVLPRAISLDVNITRETGNQVVIHSSSSDELTPTPQNSHKVFSITEPLQVIEENDPLGAMELTPVENNSSDLPSVPLGVTEATETEEEADVQTPMLASRAILNHVTSKVTHSTSQNGTFPYTPISKLNFVHLKESIV